MKKVSLIMDYEKTMIREDKKNYKTIQKHEGSDEGLVNAVILLKYVFECILDWSPYMIRDYFTPEISEWLQLDNCVSKIPFPIELDQSKDYFYVAHYLYPKTLPYNKKKTVLDIYDRKRMKNITLPRGFFSDKEGKDNFDICLKYVISEKFYTMESKDIYEFFSDSKRARSFMIENNLITPCDTHYSSILEAVHSVLPEGDKNDTLYHFITLKNYLKKQKIDCKVIEQKEN